jgi:predicted enzyme related to lactoylglutathione lyase
MATPPAPGSIAWIDLTGSDAPGVRDFYRGVVGWSASEVDMGGYSDFCMHPAPDAPPVAGVCHAQGHNADLPPQWLIYINVADLDASLERYVALGGSVLVGPKGMGDRGRFAVIRDPAGAVAALYGPSTPRGE